MKLSHVQIKVNDLKKAIRDFRQLGFTVEYGRKPSIATNAFIWFGEDVFIEIVTMAKSAEKMKYPLGIFYKKGMRTRWEKWSRKEEGLLDFAIEGIDEKEADICNLPRIRKELNSKGLRMSRVLNGTRKPPEGDKTKFGFCAPLQRELPFVVSAYTINQKPKESFHENGARQVKYITLYCKKEDEIALKNMIGNDEKIKLIEAEETKIHSICIEGFQKPQDEKLLHGVIVEYE